MEQMNLCFDQEKALQILSQPFLFRFITVTFPWHLQAGAEQEHPQCLNLSSHRNDRWDTEQESRQSPLELRLFSSCLNTNRFLDRRSSERKKAKKPTTLSPKHIWLVVWEQQTLQELRDTVWEKIKIPKGADNVV